MALRGADVDPALVRAGSVGVYLNQFYRTRAWVGTDERAYAPGDTVTGTAFLKHNPHPSRRDLVLTQVDVYLAPEVARRKRNFTYDTRAHSAKRQNLAEFFYLRRPSPVGSATYRTYYDYGETVRSACSFLFACRQSVAPFFASLLTFFFVPRLFAYAFA